MYKSFDTIYDKNINPISANEIFKGLKYHLLF